MVKKFIFSRRPARRSARLFKLFFISTGEMTGAMAARRQRAGRRENPEFWKFQNHENVKKWFQQDHYMEIWSRGILHNDVWYL